MSETSLEQCYQPPCQPIGRRESVVANVDQTKPLEIVNLTNGKSFLRRMQSSKTEIQFSGLFSLRMEVELGYLKIDKFKIKQLSLWGFRNYDFEILNRSNLNESIKMLVEFHLPFLHPMTESGLRIYADGKLVFEQAEIPARYHLFQPQDAIPA